MRTLVSLESLLVKDVAAGGRYIGAATFETESIGFGSPKQSDDYVFSVFGPDLSEGPACNQARF